MMRIFLAILLLFPFPASAQQQRIPPCAPHDEMADVLKTVAKEHLVMVGVTKERNLVEKYASLTGTWTDVKTNMLTGMSCITDFGVNFQMRSIPPKQQST